MKRVRAVFIDKKICILVNDHAGHPFQVQLSRTLSKRGYQVLHTYSANLQTPRGRLSVMGSDPSGFAIRSIQLSDEFSRYSLIKRFFQEKELGRRLVEQVGKFSPNVVISANTPLGAQAQLLKRCRREKIKFVFWVQDLLGLGIKKYVRKKLPILGDLIGWFYILYEESMFRRSDEVVVITEDFYPIMKKARIPDNRIHVIHNWAPLEEIPIFPKSNPWSQKYGLQKKFCFVYSGTLGMKNWTCRKALPLLV